MNDLFLVPYAGGTSLTYGEWSFSEITNPIPLDYSGHGLRMKEPLNASFEELVEDITLQVVKQCRNDSISLFGHSMGALVAFDVATNLESKGFRVGNLYVSACLPPHLFDESKYIEMCTDKWLDGFLVKYGRIGSNRTKSKYYQGKIYPAIKNDYRLLSVHRHGIIRELSTNITCFYGIQDDLMSSDGMESWGKYTSGKFMIKGLSGGHFYIESDENKRTIIHIIEHGRR